MKPHNLRCLNGQTLISTIWALGIFAVIFAANLKVLNSSARANFRISKTKIAIEYFELLADRVRLSSPTDPAFSIGSHSLPYSDLPEPKGSTLSYEVSQVAGQNYRTLKFTLAWPEMPFRQTLFKEAN